MVHLSLRRAHVEAPASGSIILSAQPHRAGYCRGNTLSEGGYTSKWCRGMRYSVGQSHSDVGVYLVEWCSQKWGLSVYCLKVHVQQLQVRQYYRLHIQKYRRHTAASLAFPSYAMNFCTSYICWNIGRATLGPAYSSLVFFSLSQKNVEDIKLRVHPLKKSTTDRFGTAVRKQKFVTIVSI